MTTYALIDPPLPGTTNARRLTVPAGQAVVLRPGRPGFSLSVVPVAGGTALVEITASPSDLAPDACTWHALDIAQSGAMLYMVPGPVSALRISATTQAAAVELVA